MKLSEIRAKFPMYSDVPDDQLLIAVRQKYYSDVPMEQFAKLIEYDTQRANPTEGMSGLDKFRAGMGKAFADTARGIGQYIGAVDRADVAESRKLDAALMNTGAGMAGNITGNLAALAPTALIPGAATLRGAALIGGATGALQPSTSTGETLANTVSGGLAGPLGVMAGRGIVSMAQGGKALMEPLTKAGQERIAARVLQSSATDPAAAAAAARAGRPLVPGSDPTLAQVANDPGLAQLERTLLNNPEYAGPLQSRFANQRAARIDAVRNVAGTDPYYDAIKQGRQVFANQDYAQAMAQGIDQKMAEALAPQLESLLRRPSIQQAKSVAQRLAAENDQSITNFGSLEGLDWLKKALDNQISKASQPGSSIGKEELRGLVQTKNDLMKTLEQIAPGYKVANENFAKMSRQINSMDVARNLLETLQKPGSEYLGTSAREMGSQYAGALSKAVDSVKKQTGMNKPLSEVMNTADISALENVARDFGRKTFAENAGRATGSNTAQNLISQNMLRRIIGPSGLPESWAESTMLQSLLSPVQAAGNMVGANRRIMDRIALGLLDPVDAAVLLTQPQAASRGLLGSPTQRLLPAPSGLLGVHLVQQE